MTQISSRDVSHDQTLAKAPFTGGAAGVQVTVALCQNACGMYPQALLQAIFTVFDLFPIMRRMAQVIYALYGVRCCSA